MPIEKPIGLVNKKTGKLWAGENYGEQSQESYDKLLVAGKLNPVQQGIDRFGNYLTTSAQADPIVGSVLNFLNAGVRTITNVLPKPIKQGVGFVLDKNQEAAENIAAATGLPVSLTDPMTIADAVMGGAVTATRPAVKTAVRETLQGAATIGRNLPPPGPQLVPVGAGASPRMQLNVSKGGAVMKAVTARDREILQLGGVSTGDEIISYKQAEHLTRRAGEIQERVDKLPLMRDELNEMIENGADLQAIKNFRDTIENTKAMLHRKRSNVSVPTPEDPLWYQTTAGKAAKRQEELARGLKTGEYLEAHHLFPKVLSSAFFDRMDWMINKGIAEADDLVLMNNIAIKLGAKPGDYKSNMLNMRTKPHNELHTAMDYAKDEFNELEWAAKVNKTKNVDELLVLWRDTIQDIVLPTAQDAVSINKLDAVLQGVSTAYSGEAPIKYWKYKKKAESKKIKRGQRQKKPKK